MNPKRRTRRAERRAQRQLDETRLRIYPAAEPIDWRTALAMNRMGLTLEPLPGQGDPRELRR